MKIYLYTLLVIAFSSCCREKQTSNTITPKYLWSYNLKDQKSFVGEIFHYAEGLPQYKNIVVMFGYKEGKAIMYGLDAFTGKNVWAFSLSNRAEMQVSARTYVKDSLWVFGVMDTVYCLNIVKGTLNWKFRAPNGAFVDRDITGKDDYFFVNYDEKIKDGWVGRTLKGNVYNGTFEKFIPDLPYKLIVKYDKSDFYGRMHVTPTITQQGEDNNMVLVEYNNVLNNGSDGSAFSNEWRMGLYNLNSNSWIYDSVVATGDYGLASYSGWRAVDRDKFYSANGNIFCIDLSNGKILWKYEETLKNSKIYFDNIALINNKIYASNSTSNITVLDARSGKKLFEIEAAGQTTPLQYLNGVIYYISNDWRLRAVDAETGELLWKITSPDIEAQNSRFWIFGKQIAVVPPLNPAEKGRILVTSYLNAFAYEAVR